MAPPETDSDSRAATKKVLRMVFLLFLRRRFLRRRFSNPNSTWHQRGRLFRWRRPPIAPSRSAGKCGKIYGDHLPKLRPSDADFEEHVTNWRYTAFLWIRRRRREVQD